MWTLWMFVYMWTLWMFVFLQLLSVLYRIVLKITISSPFVSIRIVSCDDRIISSLANKCACAKIKNGNIQKLWLLHWTFPFSKAFQKIVFYFYFNYFTILRKNSGNVKFYWMTLWNKTPVVCHMASHMALVMSSITSGECVVCAYCKQN